MTFSDLSPLISAAALSVSLFTLWFTALRRGTVRSTHPSFIALRYDIVGKMTPQAKVFLRCLLFSTGKRGRIVESLSLRISDRSRASEFSFWGMGDKDLIRGSGFFIPETGVASNHHFNPTDADTQFLFKGGAYSLELVAEVHGDARLVSLWKIDLEVPPDVLESIKAGTAIFYSWSPEKARYICSIEKHLRD